MTPLISVLMPVYNGESYLREAIESILNQNYSNFEFIIIDDGSVDNSKLIVKSFKDRRIKFLVNRTNLGLPKTLNRELSLAKGKYLARMDQDDISFPKRLESQVEFMEKNHRVGAVGTAIKFLGGSNKKKFYPINFDRIRTGLLFNTQFAHPTVMLRSSYFKKHKLVYDPDFKRGGEDYDLWFRASKYFEMANLNEVFLLYRQHSNQMVSNREEIERYIKIVQEKALKDLGINPSTRELKLHFLLSRGRFTKSWHFLVDSSFWFWKIFNANTKSRRYPNFILSQDLIILALRISKYLFIETFTVSKT